MVDMPENETKRSNKTANDIIQAIAGELRGFIRLPRVLIRNRT